MKLIDMHCDTILMMMNQKEKFNFVNNDLGVDLQKLKKSNSMAQFFAAFVNLKEDNDPLERALDMIDRLYQEIDKYKGEIKIAKNYCELMNNNNEGKISAFLTIEGGEALKGKISNLRNFYKLGVRLITLTWNYKNEIGYPGCELKFKNKGLTEFGKNLVHEMNNLGVIVDVSHLNDAGFYDVIECSSKPIVASHSNARSITNHSRNLTDDMIKKLADNGGVMGINFCNAFLSKNRKASVEDMIRHIEHIRNVGGIDVIAIGTDFDGIDNPPEIEHMGEMNKLEKALYKNGFSEEEIEKIFYKNTLRIIKENL
ncbi:dipeptidase [Haloimpatiens sp. FM7330]|uniref:dipeptidase n=1 Tax=Haloimpatiens sp. FM7330 TaxID=3298610 RepID=UPI0036402694